MDTTTKDPATTRLTIDVWADVVCPWCYVGEQRLSRAIERSPHVDAIDLRLHTFELDPSAPHTVTPTVVDYLSSKYGVSADQARAMEARVAELARADGLTYSTDHPISNSFDMLRLVHLAGAHDLAWEFMRAVQAELFGGNPDVFAHETLVGLAAALGIPAQEARDVLASDRYADAVRADHAAAIELGANGVPFTVLADRLGIPGAVSVEQYTMAIDQAWEQLDDRS